MSDTTPRPPLWVAIEGPKGSGKTTQTRRVADALAAAGQRVVSANAGTPTVHSAREMTPWEKALCGMLARAQVVENVREMTPAPTVVVCDNWSLGTWMIGYAEESKNSLIRPAFMDLAAAEHLALPPVRHIILRDPPHLAADAERYERAYELWRDGRTPHFMLAPRFVDVSGPEEATTEEIIRCIRHWMCVEGP